MNAEADTQPHVCGPDWRRLYDARGIYCCRICDVCEKKKRQQWRPEVLTDPNYEACEDIEAD